MSSSTAIPSLQLCSRVRVLQVVFVGLALYDRVFGTKAAHCHILHQGRVLSQTSQIHYTFDFELI